MLGNHQNSLLDLAKRKLESWGIRQPRCLINCLKDGSSLVFGVCLCNGWSTASGAFIEKSAIAHNNQYTFLIQHFTTAPWRQREEEEAAAALEVVAAEVQDANTATMSSY